METILWMEKYMSEAEHMIFDGRVEEGLGLLTNLLFDEPGYASLHNHLGWAYMYHAQNDLKAELHFNMAMRFSPEFAPPFLHMGNLCMKKGRHVEAIAYFTEGLTKPNALRSALLEGIGHAHEVSGAFALAVRAYKEAAKATAVDFEVDRILNAVKRCRKKRITLLFSFW